MPAKDVAQFRQQNGFEPDDEKSSVWMATLGPYALPLPNFRWRRDILEQHDRNHLISGYDTSAKGELLVAAWEIGSGCYPDIRARMLCGFLMILGLLRYPVSTWRAFRLGARHLRQTYG
ncbi:hypothetical protein [Alterisphingorhabdus coralli]|uniref:Uncharacterized protein n=1 Tax=Alterisphingorhabdus coralli TaxID=3071408 RepID=A0AA97F7B2_9SPHN|nr:hypothetical protein [Parasphingorhabdus sp. SCSIO 66989]WOE75298.1 hypothetical protein RB602_00855 [Parasphingorhabdus sp. SCSIO 66989]